MNRATKRLLAKQEAAAEREKARGGGDGRSPAAAGRGSGGFGAGRPPAGVSSGPREGRLKRFRRFLREVRVELKKVAWPTRSEVFTYTVVVIVSVAFVTTLVFALDFLFGKGILAIFGN